MVVDLTDDKSASSDRLKRSQNSSSRSASAERERLFVTESSVSVMTRSIDMENSAKDSEISGMRTSLKPGHTGV